MADEHITEKRRNRKRKNAQSETQGDERVGTFVISDTIEDSGSRAILGIDLFEEEEGRYHVHTSTSYSLSEAFSEGKSEGLSYSEGSTTSSSEAKSLTRSYSKGHASSYVQTKGRETSGIFSSNERVFAGDDEQQLVVQAIQRQGHFLIYGKGGVGKMTLARELMKNASLREFIIGESLPYGFVADETEVVNTDILETLSKHLDYLIHSVSEANAKLESLILESQKAS